MVKWIVMLRLIVMLGCREEKCRFSIRWSVLRHHFFIIVCLGDLCSLRTILLQGLGLETLLEGFDGVRERHEKMAPAEYNEDGVYKAVLNEVRRLE